jgi:uncharacterized protein YdeI (YjbR/CyaY-like superfamily)
MSSNLGTPNQKALYSTLGNVLQETVSLLDMKTPEIEVERKLKVVNTVTQIASEMTKARLAEIMAAKVSGDKIRSIERKSFDEVEVIE